MSKRKNYTKEFKTEVVNMVLNEGNSIRYNKLRASLCD